MEVHGGGRGAGSLRVPPRNVPSTMSPLRRVAAPKVQVHEEEGESVESTMTQPKQGGTKAKQIPKDVRERAWATMRRGGQIDLLKALVRRTLVKLITISS